MNELWVSEGFVNCIREIYNSTKESDPIRRTVVQVAKAHLAKLWIKKSFQELIREGGDFLVDFIGTIAS